MAIGLGKLFGFEFLENFDYPYISKSITEFWRRWHISLGSWFRDYVYFPMGGSKVHNSWKHIRNLLVVWLLTGIWHGANWTFIIWGLMYFVLLVIEKFTGLKDLLKSKTFSCIYRVITLLFVLIGWVIFRSDSITEGIYYILSMFALKDNVIYTPQTFLYIKENAVFLLLAILCSTPIFKILKQRLMDSKLFSSIGSIVIPLGYSVIFIISVSYLVMGTNNPFIYFNF